jgi:hypothetical protein
LYIEENVFQVLEDYIKMGLFPQSLLSGETTLKDKYSDNDLDIEENGDVEELQQLENVNLQDGTS